MRQSYIFADRATIHDVIHSRETQVQKVLAEIPSESLRAHSIEDLTSGLVERLRLEVPVMDRTGIKELESQEVDIDVSGAPNRAFFEPGPHYVKGTLVRISVPFTGEGRLFRYPSSNLGNHIPAEVVDNTIVLAHAAEHPDQSEVRRDFDNRLLLIETALQFVRGPADEWNRRLPDMIRAELQERKAKLERDQGFTLGYPKAPPFVRPQANLGITPQKRPSNYDLFLSHASEDKETVARPLYNALRASGVTVWFDDAVLKMGDSLRRKIDDGLSICRYGIVIISPSFLMKEWPQRELDGLVAREAATGKKAILPIWHQIDRSALVHYSPILADRLAGRSEEGVEALVRKILDAIR
jgi:hypothetical protein